MTRREFLAASTAAAVTLPTIKVLGAPRPKRPNLLFVLTDQQSFDMINATNPQLHTPVLNELARQGVRFDRVISNAPVCTPYRGMLMSGQHPLYNGCLTNDVPLLPTSNDRFAHVLNRAGYETAYIGKWHIYGGGGRDTGIPPGPNRQGFDGTFLTNNVDVNYRPDACFYWDDANHKIHFKDIYPDKPWELEAQTRQAEEWFGRRNQAKPFALFVSWHPPHDFAGDGCPDLPGRQYNYNVADLDPALIKPYANQDIRVRPGSPVDPQMKGCQENQYRNYMAMITACDTMVGRLIAQLKQQGVYDDTLLVFTSDHGDMLGSHGAQTPKTVPQDYSMRVPMIMRWPGQLAAGTTTDLMVSALDIMPTILGLLDLPIPAVVQGKNLAAAIRHSDRTVVESVPIFMYPGSGAWRGVYTKEWTYARGLASESMRGGVVINILYHHQNDPAQLNNLFGHPDHAAIQAELEAQTQIWMKRFGDRNFTWAEMEAAVKKTGLPSWRENYAHRPIDVMNRYHPAT